MKVASISAEPASAPKALDAKEPVVLPSQGARGLITLTLNRPQAFNALSEAMLAALQLEFDAIAQDESVRVVVLAAEGKAFCAGHDLKEMRAAPSLEYYQELFARSEEHTSELQSQSNLVCRLLLEKKKLNSINHQLD